MSDPNSLPRLIVFEGADAVGKSAICDGYVKALSSFGIRARLLSFPGKATGTLGGLVYRLHHDPASNGVEQMTPLSLQALHVAAHLDAIQSAILPYLEAGDTVVLDRYWWSTWVYGVADGGPREVLHALIEAERLAWGKWQPGIVFHVCRATPLREEPSEKWAKLVSEYHALAEREKSKYPVSMLSNESNLNEAVRSAIAESHRFKP